MKEAAESENPDINESEAESRQNFDWQRRFARALHGYATTVRGAFAALQQVHELLEENGVEEDFDGVAPLARSVLQGCREAHTCARHIDEAVTSLLDTHCSTLDVCERALAESDSASAKVRYYKNKVEGLEEAETERGGPQGSAFKDAAKLGRNREKLREASDTERVLHIRAIDSLNSVVLRRDNLCQLAKQVVTGTVQALRLSVAHVSCEEAAVEIKAKNPFACELDTDMSSVSTGSGSAKDGLVPSPSPPQPKWTNTIAPPLRGRAKSDGSDGTMPTQTPGDSATNTPGRDSDTTGTNPFDEFEAPPLVLELAWPKKLPVVRQRFRPPGCLAWCRPR
jgi:hypothetical protein